MAANVAYKVNGKADVTPLQKTEQALKKISTAAGAMKTAIAGFAIAKVFQGANAVINGATDAFKNMNTALAKSNIAFSENAKLTKESVSNIREALSEFSAGNFFDGDSLNNAASIASQMGLDENQIKSVMDAATEMAASGILPLEEAVKKLSFRI
jgi:septation ring formation regulator EzrA